MENMTVSEVSKTFHISTRMLRYYETKQLIASHRKDNYAYRIYDLEQVKRLQIILILRKLHISIKEIAVILDDTAQMQTLHILQENINKMDQEIAALETVRNLLSEVAKRFDRSIQEKVHLDLLSDQNLIQIVDTLLLPTNQLKERDSMAEQKNAENTIAKEMEIRILYLPPVTVVSSHYIGENPEDTAQNMLQEFITKVRLPEVKPDFRVFGFNNPSPQEGKEQYGYEFWVTIPETMEVEPPLEKKTFAGGLYAAHCIKMGEFQEWELFVKAMEQNKEYEMESREPQGMYGAMEEHLNGYSVFNGTCAEFTQLDLLIPIKKIK